MTKTHILKSGIPNYSELEVIVDKDSKSVDIIKVPEFRFDPNSFEILSTIRYDPLIVKKPPKSAKELTKKVFFLWDLHIARLQLTLDFFVGLQTGSTDTSRKRKRKASETKEDEESFVVESEYILEQIRSAFIENNVLTVNPLKIRLLLSVQGEVRVECHATPERPNLMLGLTENYPSEQIYDIYVDETKVFASPFTTFKTTSRDVYNNARKRCLKGESQLEEVLLINSCLELMEGSIFNVAIELNDGQYLTPPLLSGCLCGVTRAMLLSKGLIREDVILIEELQIGHEVLLFNGIVGVSRGIIRGFVEAEEIIKTETEEADTTTPSD